MKRFVLLSALVVAIVVVASAWPIETSAQNAGWLLALNGVRWDRRPLQGAHGLRSGFLPAPFPYRLTAGGGRNPVRLDGMSIPGCTLGGCVTRRPDFRFFFEAGTSFRFLRFYVVSNADSLLLINGPNGSWRCNDDHGQAGWGNRLMPALDYHNPSAGQYDIWVGTFPVGGSCPSHQPATLYVTELQNNHP